LSTTATFLALAGWRFLIGFALGVDAFGLARLRVTTVLPKEMDQADPLL